jgi:hypothetical protein
LLLTPKLLQNNGVQKPKSEERESATVGL